MYEAGWGKKLSYIMAYSKDEVQDVTWRYSSNHRDVLSRRNLCTEAELVSAMVEMREKRWKTFTPLRKQYVLKRLCVELVDMMEERYKMILLMFLNFFLFVFYIIGSLTRTKSSDVLRGRWIGVCKEKKLHMTLTFGLSENMTIYR